MLFPQGVRGTDSALGAENLLKSSKRGLIPAQVLKRRCAQRTRKAEIQGAVTYKSGETWPFGSHQLTVWGFGRKIQARQTLPTGGGLRMKGEGHTGPSYRLRVNSLQRLLGRPALSGCVAARSHAPLPTGTGTGITPSSTLPFGNSSHRCKLVATAPVPSSATAPSCPAWGSSSNLACVKHILLEIRAFIPGAHSEGHSLVGRHG